MKKVLTIILFLVSTSCSQRQQSLDKDFIDKLLDLTTATSSEEYVGEEYVQLTHLYDTLAHNLPEDRYEELILVERLKKRSFEIIHWSRGNFPPLGARIVIVELKKENCFCEVVKIYYATIEDNAFQMAEGINCKRIDSKKRL